jgi:hypothetical protein
MAEKAKLVKNLESHEKNMVFAAMLLDRDLYKRAADNIDTESMPEIDDLYRFWLEELKEYEESYAVWPTIDIFRNKVNESVQDDPNFDEFKDSLMELFRLAVKLEKTVSDYLVVLNEKLSRYIGQLLSAKLADQLTKSVRTSSESELIDEIRNKLLIANASNDDMFADPIDIMLNRPMAGKASSTGVSFVDTLTGGKPAARECVLHGAVSGGGKSTLVNQVGSNIAIAEQRLAAEQGRPPEWVYIVNYERIEDPIQHIISNIGNICRDSITEFITKASLASFSEGGDIDSYKPYEKKLLKNLIQRARAKRASWPRGERGRYQRAREIMSRNIQLVDFSHSQQSLVKYATRLVDGIADYVEMHQRKLGNPGVAFVGLDYAGTCANTYIGATAKSDSQLRRVLTQIPLDCKHNVANRFNCITWISHQLAAAEAKRKPGTTPDKTAFREALGITENADFAFVSGVPTPTEGLAVFVQAKGRRGAPIGYGIPARLDNTFCRWEAADGDYEVMNNEIMHKDDARKLRGFSGGDIRENFE